MLTHYFRGRRLDNRRFAAMTMEDIFGIPNGIRNKGKINRVTRSHKKSGMFPILIFIYYKSPSTFTLPAIMFLLLTIFVITVTFIIAIIPTITIITHSTTIAALLRYLTFPSVNKQPSAKRQVQVNDSKKKKPRTASPIPQDDEELAKLENQLRIQHLKNTIRKEAAEIRQLELKNLQQSRELGIEINTGKLEMGFEKDGDN